MEHREPQGGTLLELEHCEPEGALRGGPLEHREPARCLRGVGHRELGEAKSRSRPMPWNIVNRGATPDGVIDCEPIRRGPCPVP
jgi:hypothetical protein